MSGFYFGTGAWAGRNQSPDDVSWLRRGTGPYDQPMQPKIWWIGRSHYLPKAKEPPVTERKDTSTVGKILDWCAGCCTSVLRNIRENGDHANGLLTEIRDELRLSREDARKDREALEPLLHANTDALLKLTDDLHMARRCPRDAAKASLVDRIAEIEGEEVARDDDWRQRRARIETALVGRMPTADQTRRIIAILNGER